MEFPGIETLQAKLAQLAQKLIDLEFRREEERQNNCLSMETTRMIIATKNAIELVNDRLSLLGGGNDAA